MKDLRFRPTSPRAWWPTSGSDFRAAHRIVGRLVTELSNQNRPLRTLTVSELETALPSGVSPLSQASLEALLDPAQAVDQRSETGCAGPKPFESMLDEAERELQRGDAWATAVRDRLDRADRELTREARHRASRRG